MRPTNELNKEKISERILYLLKVNNLTISNAAKELDISYARMYNFTKGTTLIPNELAVRMLKLPNVQDKFDIEWLYSGVTSSNSITSKNTINIGVKDDQDYMLVACFTNQFSTLAGSCSAWLYLAKAKNMTYDTEEIIKVSELAVDIIHKRLLSILKREEKEYLLNDPRTQAYIMPSAKEMLGDFLPNTNIREFLSYEGNTEKLSNLLLEISKQEPNFENEQANKLIKNLGNISSVLGN